MERINDASQLAVGDYVTLYDRVQRYPRNVQIAGDTDPEEFLRVFRGCPLEVRAICPPFVMCALYVPWATNPYPFSLQMDYFNVVRVASSFADSFRRKPHDRLRGQ